MGASRWLRGVVLALVGAVVLGACSSPSAAPSGRAEWYDAGAAGEAAPASPPTLQTSAAAELPSTAAIQTKLIYTGAVTIEVNDVDRALAEVRGVVQGLGGYAGDLTQTLSGTARAEITLRVPVEKFEPLMTEISALGRPLSREIGTQDVGEEWVDLEARVKTKRQGEQRLIELLKQTGNVQNLLEVERELARVRGEIEQVEGRQRYLANQVALSTVTVTLVTPAGVQPVAGWRYGTVWGNAINSFAVVGQGLLTLATYALVLAPYWLGLWALVVAWRRWRARRQAAALASGR